jgi:DNA polymerase-3 subunit beta
MKVQSTIEKISHAVSKVQKISAKNVSLPVLENVLLTTEKNNLIFRVTNLHVGVEVTVPVKVEKQGTIAVNLTIFSNIISSIKNGQNINLEVEDQTLNITTDDSTMELKVSAHEDFPTLPQPKEEDFFTLPIEKFIEGVRSVMYSASQSDIKPEISSVYIYNHDGDLTFVSTDSFRLAEKKVSIKGLEDFPGVIVPIKNIQECVKIFTGDESDVKLFIEKNQLTIVSNDTYFTSRIVDGNYPDYQQIIPKEFSTEAVVLKDDLVQTLRLVNVFSNTFNQVSIKTLSKEGRLSISSRNTDIGENNSLVDAAVKGDDVETYVNHRYISDIFNSTPSDSISFSFIEKNKPFMVKGVGDESFLYLIMPMNR